MTTDPSPFLTALRLSDSFLPVGDTRPPTVSSSTATRIGSRPATICGNCSRPTSVAWSVPAKLSRWPTLTPRAQNPISSGCWSSTSDSMRSPCPESSARVRPRRARSSPNCSGRTGRRARTRGQERAWGQARSLVRRDRNGDRRWRFRSDRRRRDRYRFDAGPLPGRLRGRHRVSRPFTTRGLSRTRLLVRIGAARGGPAARSVRAHRDPVRARGAAEPTITEVCERHVDDEPTAMASFAPLAEIMGMNHERAGRRLFMS